MTPIFKELVSRQLKTIKPAKKLQYNDLKRISKHVNGSLFGNKCCLWTNSITNIKNPYKGIYVNFYFNGKKRALHRLLYGNFIGNLKKGEYVKYICNNKGKCCNIRHLAKYSITPKKANTVSDWHIIDSDDNDTSIIIDSMTEIDPHDFIVKF